MKRRSSRPQFVNIHGLPWGRPRPEPDQSPPSSEHPPKDAAALGMTPADIARVFDALCLAGWQRRR